MRLGLGIRNRLTRAWSAWSRRRRQRPRGALVRQSAARLHIGSGPNVLTGWENVDIQHFLGVRHVMDVRDGLPFRDVEYIYAEHFLEHLTHDEGLRFLAECRAALAQQGVLRLSTPNLEWVVRTQYPQPSGDRIHDCFALNKAFRGWGHQFLYNLETLTAALRDAGFEQVRAFAYGESDDPVLRGLERHERSADSPELPHVIVVEARGARARGSSLDALSDDYDRAVVEY